MSNVVPDATRSSAAYIEDASLAKHLKGPLFRPRLGQLTRTPCPRPTLT
jgi:hypothetical protein